MLSLRLQMYDTAADLIPRRRGPQSTPRGNHLTANARARRVSCDGVRVCLRGRTKGCHAAGNDVL